MKPRRSYRRCARFDAHEDDKEDTEEVVYSDDEAMLELSRELRKGKWQIDMSFLSRLADRDYTNCFYSGSL